MKFLSRIKKFFVLVWKKIKKVIVAIGLFIKGVAITIYSWIRKFLVPALLGFAFLVILFFIIFGPWIIRTIVYDKSAIKYFGTIFTSGDGLNYYAVVISSIVGAFGIFITILNSSKKYSEDVRNQALPFLALDQMMKRCGNPLRKNSLDRRDFESGYSEYELRDIVFDVKKDEIEVKCELSPEQIDMINYNGIMQKHKSNETVMYLNPFNFIPYKIVNVGKGAAINLMVGFNKAKTSSKKKIYSKPVNLNVNEEFNVHIFVDMLKENVDGKYVLELNYFDIYNNNYIQKFDVELSESGAVTNAKHIQKIIKRGK